MLSLVRILFQRLGSNDLSIVAELLNKKTMEEQSSRLNTVVARTRPSCSSSPDFWSSNTAGRSPNCRYTLSSASWTTLQVRPHMFQDVFSELYEVLPRYGPLYFFCRPDFRTPFFFFYPTFTSSVEPLLVDVICYLLSFLLLVAHHPLYLTNAL
ncbi:MAG: hypothetical protein J3R72DRAFT_162041 [Linnemannia gamsii]|nr:MAG: hypothetical protein J3R72DRAFT_162041 [Linnemannia gamsii]